MQETVRWVSKTEASEELDVSLSTLDRMIRKGEVEIRRKGRRVYVRMEGAEYLNIKELLRRAEAREEELQHTVGELERSVATWQAAATRLEQERDEAKRSATSNQPYLRLRDEHNQLIANHDWTKFFLWVVSVALVVSLAALTIWILIWWFFLR